MQFRDTHMTDGVFLRIVRAGELGTARNESGRAVAERRRLGPQLIGLAEGVCDSKCCVQCLNGLVVFLFLNLNLRVILRPLG